MPRLFVALALALVTALAASCAKKEAEQAEVMRYQVRGQVDAMQEGKLYVFHEAIPEFVGRSGEVVGMDSMQMPFGVGSGVDTSDIAVGDKVKMTVEVRFDADPPLTIVELSELPADTALELAR